MNAVKQRVVSGSEVGEKTNRYRPNPADQSLLWDVNQNLHAMEQRRIEQTVLPRDPQLLFLTYVPRSGSTVLSQLLARTGWFNYISNFQARFWLAPFVGGRLEQLLSPRCHSDIPLTSDYGLTSTLSSPSEFSYFWEHWFRFAAVDPDAELPHTLDGQLAAQLVDWDGLIAQLKLISTLESGPLFFKKEWLGMNGSWLLDRLPSARLLHVTRDPLDVAYSVYRARQAVFGRVDAWWGARPADYATLSEAEWPAQIAGQVAGILRDIGAACDRYPERCLTLAYEDVMQDVCAAVSRLGQWLQLPTAELGAAVQLDQAHLTRPVPKRDASVVRQLERALAKAL